MNTYTIYAYFNADQIQAVLNSIVMLMGSTAPDGDYLSVLRVAGMIGLILSVTMGLVRARGEDAGMYLIMMALFYSILFVPRVTVTIEEKGGYAAGAPVAVDNVPLGLAFFAATTSHIGYWLTERTETMFSLPSTELMLGSHGLFGAARTLRESQSAAMPDPVLAQDMVNFMRDCINPELITSSATVASLMKSTNLWNDFNALGLINPGRMVVLAGSSTVEPCDTAYTTTLGSRLAPAATEEASRIARILSPSAPLANANTMLAAMLPAAESLIMTASASTTEGIRQRMMINMLNDTSANMAQIMNDPSAAQTALGTAMASQAPMQAIASWPRLRRKRCPWFATPSNWPFWELSPSYWFSLLCGKQGRIGVAILRDDHALGAVVGTPVRHR
ncbi:MAG: conjugal transfer protein TraG N-terminal domain-containing protein [Propionivibrio sp.]|uniref:Conjugal transfer protein TraG N-terminal domain-containing protein n=1 Tax=Candidatus Propionivibrio dominans TaxID=2954373 RepID=A0A9D7FES8_9RHOO|nr:conjugal transfer protein TraG N-terminal domain-containing protein [Candidatus Propionivibrio dominans]